MTSVHIAQGADAVTVVGTIEKINLLERTITVKVPGNEPSIELELTRKTKIFCKAVPAGADAIKVGSKALIKYNTDLMVAFSVEADSDLTILNLEELNSPQKDYFPWVSPDGLEIFWSVDQDRKPTIWSARRKTPESVFGDKKQFYFGRSPVLSADCLQIYFRNPELDGIYVATRNHRDDDFNRPVKVPSLSFPHREAAPRWLTDDGLTLYLDMVNGDVLHKGDLDSSDDDDEFEPANSKSPGTAHSSGRSKKEELSSYRVCWVTTRESANSEWQRPTIVQAEFEGKPKNFYFNFAAATPDNLRLFCVSNLGLGVLSRLQPSGPYTHWDEIRINTPDGRPLFCERIQYVAATHELFLTSNNLYPNPALKRKRWMDLWVVKDFQYPSGAAQK